jgi:cyclopropane fatty-acyl-phospholipid synthase-like methyltransferase
MVTTKRRMIEFNALRSQMYEEALRDYPLARAQDIQAMQRYLAPKKGEVVLGIGEGNGYFCQPILNAIGTDGKYLVTDPSADQLSNLSNRVKVENLEVQVAGAESFRAQKETFDKIWSFGAFHHCPNQTKAMRRIYNSLKTEGRLVICDVFQGSKLAKHFDGPVARYCNTGHEVKFMSDEFARSLCYLAGFKEQNVQIIDLPQKWIFKSEEDLGDFVYKIHAMTLVPGNEKERIRKIIDGCKEILGVEQVGNNYELNWPMKVLVAEK